MKLWIMCVIFSLATSNSHAAITHRANDALNANDSGSVATVTTLPTIQGNMMIVGVGWCCNSGGVVTITDNKGNTWTQAGPTVADTYNDWNAVFYAPVSVSGTTSVNLSISGGQAFAIITFAEFAGVKSSGSLDVCASALTSNTNTPTSGPLTPSQTGELLFMISLDDNSTGGVPTAGSGFTLLSQRASGATQSGIGAQYLIYASTTSVSGTQTWPAASGNSIGLMCAFKPSPIGHKATVQ